MNLPPTLQYDTRTKRHLVSYRTAKLLVAVTFLAVFLAVAWRNWGDWIYASVRGSLAEAAAARKFARTFDAAARTLTPHGGVWLAPLPGGTGNGGTGNGGPGKSSPAEKLLDAMLAECPGAAADQRRIKPGIILFVRRHDDTKRSWLSFASFSGAGLEVYSFERVNRNLARHDLVLETPALARSSRVPIALVDIQAEGDTILTALTVGGVRHDVTWTPGQPASAGGGAPLPTVTPHNGWVTGTEWELAQRGWRFVSGSPPDAVWPRRPIDIRIRFRVPPAAAFTPDGRVAVADSQRIARFDPSSGQVEAHALPVGLGTSATAYFKFSPRGTWLLIGGETDASYLVDTLTGSARQLAAAGESGGAAFADDRTLLEALNWRQAYVDCETFQERPFSLPRFEPDPLPPPESLPLGFFSPFDAAGDKIVLSSFGTVHLLERGTMKVLRKFDSSEVGSDCSLSPDGATLAGSGDTGLRLTDVRTGTTLWSEKGWRRVGRGAWSADGRRVAAADARWAYVWSLDEPRRVARFPLGPAAAGAERPERQWSGDAVALSPDGKRLVAVGPAAVAYWRDIDAAALGDGKPDHPSSVESPKR